MEVQFWDCASDGKSGGRVRSDRPAKCIVQGRQSVAHQPIRFGVTMRGIAPRDVVEIGPCSPQQSIRKNAIDPLFSMNGLAIDYLGGSIVCSCVLPSGYQSREKWSTC
jgi:hypothetical protein